MSFQIPKVEFEIDDIDSLHLDVYTIGYKEEGESLLLLLCDGKNILHSTMTDCYCIGDYNHANTILDDLEIKNIDAFVWTHPDSDHSTGIEPFLGKYDASADARIFIPAGLGSEIIDTDEAKNALTYITNKYNRNRRYNIDYVSLNSGEFRQLMRFRIKEKTTSRQVDYMFTFILPNADIVARRSNNDCKVLMNDYSIFYIVTFNDQNYLFCGDLSKQNVQFINEDWLEDVVFVKIPHHGSKTINNFRGKLVSREAKDVICTCTTFKSKQLPDESVLNAYKDISKAVFCTGKNEEKPQNNFGCVLNVFNANMKDGVSQCMGNAYKYN